MTRPITRILRLDASSRPSPDAVAAGVEGSYSRALGDHLIAEMRAAHDEAHVITRDLVADPVPHIADETIKGYYTPPEAMTDALREATALSDRLVADLKAADALVVTAPLYNFSLPSALKAWIDQVVRMGHTFAYEGGAFRGLVEDKPAFLVLSYGAGGYGPGGPMEAYDHMRPYLTMVLNFIGITDVTVFDIEATTASPDVVSTNVAAARAAVTAHFADREPAIAA